MNVMQFPLAKISISFIVGLLIAYYLQIPYNLSLLLFGILFIVLLLVFHFSKNKIHFGYAVIACSISLGFWITAFHHQPNNSGHYVHFIEENTSYTTKICIKERLKNNAFNDRFVGEIQRVNGIKKSGKIIVNIRKDSLNSSLEIGSMIVTTAKFHLNKAPKNPNQFDYSRYLSRQQIYAQMYTDASEIQIGTTVRKDLNYYGARIRNSIITQLEHHQFKKEELSVVVALILGQQQDISKEVLRDYQYAGAVHILSVSGLHVGCIMLFVMALLKPIPNHKKGTLIKLGITLLFLWSFGILAGLAPSVLRSVTMYSFLAVGLFLKRSVNIYHSLLVSMFVILVVQPSFLFDVGFQLSYLALFFIIWLQPLLASLWEPNYKITKYFWDILTVSFTAQLGTLPLSIYYFHQFPGLFFVTNLIILPLLSVILALALVVMILAAIGFVPYFLMKTLEWSIGGLNQIISWIASFEEFIFKDIPLSYSMMLAAYLALISGFIWMQQPSYKKLRLALLSILIFQGSCWFTKYQTQITTEFIVFQKNKKSMIIERNAHEVVVFTNDSIRMESAEDQAIQSYLTANFSKLKQQNAIQNFYYFKGNKIALMDSSGVFTTKNPDVLILTQSPKINLNRFLVTYKPKVVVADASNYVSYKKLWKATCAKEKIPFHDTSEKGFYKL
jgi:competence protein ComEC